MRPIQSEIYDARVGLHKHGILVADTGGCLETLSQWLIIIFYFTN